MRRQELVVGGYKPGTAGRAGPLGSLLLGVYTGGGLAYAGHIGTGFNQAALRMLEGRLAAPRRGTPPFTPWYPAGTPAARCGWSRGWWSGCSSPCGPELVNSATPSYKGLRDDKDPREVVREP